MDMDFPREEVQAAADRYVAIRHDIHESTEPNFGLLADLYTDDAVYFDAGGFAGKTVGLTPP